MAIIVASVQSPAKALNGHIFREMLVWKSWTNLYRGIDMLVDRRRSERLACERLAKIQFYYGSLPRDYMITDVSESDVKVFTEDYDVPPEFIIIFSIGHSCRCHLGWRNGCEFGAEFIDQSNLATATHLSGAA